MKQSDVERVGGLQGIADEDALDAMSEQLKDIAEERQSLTLEANELAVKLDEEFTSEQWKLARENQSKMQQLDVRERAVVKSQIEFSQNALAEATRIRQLTIETIETLSSDTDLETAAFATSLTVTPQVEVVTADETGSGQDGFQENETDYVVDRAVTVPTRHRITASTPCGGNNSDSTFEHSMAKSIQVAIEASSSSITKSMLKIEACVPQAGSSYISMVEWSRWKDLLLVTLCTVPGLTEIEKKVTFLRSAGPFLLDVLESVPEAVDDPLKPFSNTMSTLDGYFGSDACIRLARLTFKEMSQLANESNVDFIARLMKFIKGCGYGTEYMEDHLMDVIARKSNDSDIRKEAQTYDRVTGKRCSYNQLREFSLQLESIRRMEKEHSAYARKSIAVNAVETKLTAEKTDRASYTHQREKGWLSARNPSRAQQPDRFPQRGPRNNKQQECECCGSWGHNTQECRHTSKRCHNCDRTGHLAYKCPRSSLKRSSSGQKNEANNGDGGSRKIFAVEEGLENEVEN